MILIAPHPTLLQLKKNVMQSQEQMEAELGKAGQGSGAAARTGRERECWASVVGQRET